MYGNGYSLAIVLDHSQFLDFNLMKKHSLHLSTFCQKKIGESRCPWVNVLKWVTFFCTQIDRLFQWQGNPHNDVKNTINKQKPNTKMEFEERAQQVVVQFAEQVRSFESKISFTLGLVARYKQWSMPSVWHGAAIGQPAAVPSCQQHLIIDFVELATISSCKFYKVDSLAVVTRISHNYQVLLDDGNTIIIPRGYF